MPELNTDIAEAAVCAAPTAGALLTQARERSGLTREAVADQLNLLPSQVAALEADDYSCFPGETFVRGHLRSCARLLDIDTDELLRAYGGAVPEVKRAAPAPAHFRWRPISLEQKNSHWLRYSGLVATVLVLALLWAWQQHQDRGHLLSLTADSGGSGEFAGGIDSALDNGAGNALLNSVQLLPDPVKKPQAASSADKSGAAKTASGQEIDRLSLRFSADCWVEVKDRDNRLLVAALKHADDKLQVEGHGPFKVLLGYAPGVSMAYNGTPVKVDVTDGSRSTRMIVGNS